MELLLPPWEDLPELYRNTDKTEATEIVIIDSQMNYRGKLDTYLLASDRQQGKPSMIKYKSSRHESLPSPLNLLNPMIPFLKEPP